MAGGDGDLGNPVEGPVDLRFPADARMARLARLAASAVGTAAGFSIADVEDLRIAVDELCSSLIEVSVGGFVDLRFQMSDGVVEVSGSVPASSLDTLDLDRRELSDRILDIVADRHSLDLVSGNLRLWLLKSASGDSVGGA